MLMSNMGGKLAILAVVPKALSGKVSAKAWSTKVPELKIEHHRKLSSRTSHHRCVCVCGALFSSCWSLALRAQLGAFSPLLNSGFGCHWWQGWWKGPQAALMGSKDWDDMPNPHFWEVVMAYMLCMYVSCK